MPSSCDRALRLLSDLPLEQLAAAIRPAVDNFAVLAKALEPQMPNIRANAAALERLAALMHSEER